jgi:hypothetical protein
LVVRVELSAPAAHFDPGPLIEGIKSRTSSQMDVIVDCVDQIQRTKNGKFRAVVSDLNRKSGDMR